MEAVIFVGLQASGKSSFYKEFLFHTHMRISRDLLRTRHREQVLWQTCLAVGQKVVLDNTNPTVAVRAPFIASARAAGFRVVGCYFRSELEACRRRNEARAAGLVVPLPGLRSTLSRLERPSLAEGFDELRYVELREGEGFLVKEWLDEVALDGGQGPAAGFRQLPQDAGRRTEDADEVR